MAKQNPSGSSFGVRFPRLQHSNIFSDDIAISAVCSTVIHFDLPKEPNRDGDPARKSLRQTAFVLQICA